MGYDGFDRTVDVHIKRIRENLGFIPDFGDRHCSLDLAIRLKVNTQ